MGRGNGRVRVLYSLPHKLGADRICTTAWQQVAGLAAAGADVLVFPGVLHKPVPANVKVRPTLACRKLRIPYKLLGRMRALVLHDLISTDSSIGGNSKEIFSLVTLELWHRAFLEKETVPLS